MSVTQQQIANHLKVSRALVGRALSDDPSISPSTRDRIRSAARELGYDLNSNQAARNLAAKRNGSRTRTGAIGILLPDFWNLYPRRAPFFLPFFEGVEVQAAACGLDVCMCWMREDSLPPLVRQGSFDGLVSLATGDSTALLIEALDIPTVYFQESPVGAHYVGPDDRNGMRLATQHLLNLGHRNIAFLGPRNDDNQHLPGEDRFLGFRDALEAAGANYHPEWSIRHLSLPIPTDTSFCKGCNHCSACCGWDALLQSSNIHSGRPPFTAVVCHNDITAMGLIRHAEAWGLKVPEDLSVVAFDDLSKHYHFTPAITSADASRFEMGSRAVTILHELTNPQKFAPPAKRNIFPVEVAIHQSTAPLIASEVMR